MDRKLYIKNMVCRRCVEAVRAIFEESNIEVDDVLLGEAVLHDDISDEQKASLAEKLQARGFELIDDRRSRIIEQIKTLLIEFVHYSDGGLRTNLSDLISENLHLDYNYVSNLFSAVQGVTIEKYFIAHKIERAKELLIYDELSLSEIAMRLGYSSTAHLSAQFKRVTGLTPTQFKRSHDGLRKPLDEV